MTKNIFKKYQKKIIQQNIFFFVLIFLVLLLTLYIKNVNNIIFRYSVLLDIIWTILATYILTYNFKYFFVKRKYQEKEGKKEKDDRKLKSYAFKFFLFTTIINFVFFIFVAEESFFGKFGLEFSENTFIFSFLALIPNIALVLAAKIL